MNQMNPFEINDVDPNEFVPQFQIIPVNNKNFIIQSTSNNRRVGMSFGNVMENNVIPFKEVAQTKKRWTWPQILTILAVFLIMSFCGWMYYNHSINEIQKDIVFCRNNADTQDKRIRAMYYDTCPKYEEYMDSPLWYIFVSLRLAAALNFFNNIGYYLSENLLAVGFFLMTLAAFLNTISDQLSKLISPFIQKHKKE